MRRPDSGYVIGSALLQMPMAFRFSIIGIVLSIIASILPARSAGRLRVREVLASEQVRRCHPTCEPIDCLIHSGHP